MTIKGSGFVAGAKVTTGGIEEASNVVVVSETEITATTGLGFTGGREVIVEDINGTSTGGPFYTYEPLEPPTVTKIEPDAGSSAGGRR